MEDIELGSHLSIKAKYFWPEGDRFRQVSLYYYFCLNFLPLYTGSDNPVTLINGLKA